MREILTKAAIATLLLQAEQPSAHFVPRTEATTLDGTRVVFPNDNGKPLLIVLSFSHKGSNDLTSWNKHFKVSYETDPRVDYFELADFQGVPSFVMKMILHGMRRSVHEPERSHFAPFYSKEDEWKKITGYKDSNVAYLALADAKGEVMWQSSGPATDAKASDLEKAITKLLSSH